MPLAPVGDSGTQLLYEDSGAPAGSTSYVTLVLIHGAVFHSAIFRRMFQFAAECNLRLVAVNLRDYPGSTPFTPSELDDLRNPSREVQASMIRDRGVELASFLAWFIHSENIPPTHAVVGPETDEGASGGGLAILAWSWGNCMTLSMLAHADSLPPDTKDLLDRYMRTFLIYDAPSYVLGAPESSLAEAYLPLLDRAIAPQEASVWISGYFAHSSSMMASLATTSRAQFFAGVAKSAISNPSFHHRPSLQRISAAETDEITDNSVIQRSHLLMTAIDPSIRSEVTYGALCNSKVWPRMRPVLVWGEMSPPEMVYAAWYLHSMMAKSRPLEGRNVIVKRMDRANHFAPWDQPEHTLRFLANLL